MVRFSLSNRFRPITFDKFQSLAADFKLTCEKEFVSSCVINIRGLSALERVTTFVKDNLIDAFNQYNSRNTMFLYDDLSKTREQDWRDAKHIDVTITPKDQQGDNECAFASIEFKGLLPLSATFYIQPGGEFVMDAMLTKYPSMRRGDGFKSHAISAANTNMRRFPWF